MLRSTSGSSSLEKVKLGCPCCVKVRSGLDQAVFSLKVVKLECSFRVNAEAPKFRDFSSEEGKT